MEGKRTVREFVEDSISNGLTGREVLVVARNTYWENQLEEVKQVIQTFSKYLKEKYCSF